MANMMQFGDFSPLDVLATAASLQSARRDSDSEGENGGSGEQGGTSQETTEDSAEQDGDINNEQSGNSAENKSMVKDTQPLQVVIEGSTEAGTDLESSGFITDLSSPISDTLGSPFSESEVFTPPPPVAPLSPALKPTEPEKPKPSCVIKLLDSNGSKVAPGDNKTSVTLKDATKIVLPTKQGPKTMTVIKINKQQVSDHSYAFLCQLQKLRSDEDEGYSSRSSVESEGEGDGQGHQSLPPGGSVVTIKTAQKPSPQTVAISGKKQPKILIVGKDKNLQKIISTNESKHLLSDLSAGKPGGSIVLRTLLGQKTVANTANSNGKHDQVSLMEVSATVDGGEQVVRSDGVEENQCLTEGNRVPATAPLGAEQEVEGTTVAETTGTALSHSDSVNNFPGPSETCENLCSEKLNVKNEECVPDELPDSQPADAAHVTMVTKHDEDPCPSSPSSEGSSEPSRTLSEGSLETQTTCKPVVSVEGGGHDDEEVTISVTIPGIALAGNLTPPVSLDQMELKSAVLANSKTSTLNAKSDPLNDKVIEILETKNCSLGNVNEVVLNSTESNSIDTTGKVENLPINHMKITEQNSDCVSTINTGSEHTETRSEQNTETQSEQNTETQSEQNELSVDLAMDGSSRAELDSPGGLGTKIVGEEGDSATQNIVSDCEVHVDSKLLVNMKPGHSEDFKPDISCHSEESLLDSSSEIDQSNVNNNVKTCTETDKSSEQEKLDISEVCTETEKDNNSGQGNSEHPGECSTTETDKNSGQENSEIQELCTGAETEFSEPPCESQIDAILADEKSCAEQKSALVSHLTKVMPGESCEEESVIKPGGLTKNQYIIEDDVPPVTKFSSAEVQDSSIALLQADASVTSTPSTAPLEVVKLLGKPALTASSAPVATSGGKLVQKGSSIIHVIPVSGNGTVVAPSTPSVGALQYITRVPGSTTVVPGKMASSLPTTVLVPVAHPQTVKLAAIPQQVSPAVGGLRLITGASTTQLAPSPIPRDCTSPSLGSTRSEPCSPFSRFGSPTQSLCSPELGRRTPEIIGRATHIESLDKSPGDVINVKINGGQILKDAPDCTPSKKGPMSIGKMGSLSWKPLEKSSELVRLDQVLNSQGGSGRQRLRIQGSEISSKIPPEDSMMDAESESGQSSIPDATEEENSKDTVVSDDIPAEELRLTFKPQAANRTVHSYVRRNRKASHEQILFGNEPDMSVMRKSALSMSRLHPLIDHDYCMFTEFNAQIQSSIIATTECKAKTERKYTKKSKAARTNVAKSNCATSGLDKVERVREVPMKVGRGRPKKRLPEPDPEPDDTPISSPETPDPNQKAEEVKVRKQTIAEKKALERNKRVLRDGRHYVKITGSYQDEFVYFATKKTRGRRGNHSDSQQDVPVQPATVGGISVFDWYKDLSNSDKNSRFGIPTIVSEGEVQTSRGAETYSSGYLTPTSTSSAKKSSAPDRTPIHESEVVDLVCELSGFGGSEKEEPATSLITNDQNLGVARVEETGPEKLDLWAEQLSNMLTSMNDDEKQQLFQQLGDSSVSNIEGTTEQEKGGEVTVGLRDTSFDSYLADFHQDSSSGLSQGPEPTQLCDLDDINDNDLIPTEIGNMNAILGDLKSNESRKLESDTQAKAAGANLNVLLDSNTNPHVAFNMKLDKSELFPDMSTPDQPAPAADLAAPELTVVSMYWNDLPGLLINQKEHVRLVDIHKQVLPAKDTGILKKRCQMMGLEILNCSELQRDFLIRYANAAKSKSTVIVSKESAKTLIGFYVDPKPKVTKQTSDEQKEPKEVVEMKEEPVVEDVLPTMVCEAEPSVKEEVPSEVDTVTPEGTVDLPASSSANECVDVKQEEEPPITPVKIEGGKGKSRKRKVAPPTSPADPGIVKDPEYVPPEISQTSVDPPVLRAPLPAIDLKRSARLKHKKVRYDKMVQGTHYVDENDNEEKFEESPVPSPPQLKKGKERRIILNKSISKESDDSEISEDHENRDVSDNSEMFPEEMEIRKLKAKSRRKRLSNKDKKRLRRLREKVRRKQIRRKVKFPKKPSVKIDDNKIIVKIPQKSKKKLQETHVYTKKYNQEHCYAACPENFKKEESGSGEPPAPSVVLVEREDEQLTVGQSCEVQRVITVEESTKECSVEVKKRPPLEVVHRDSIHRNAQRGRSQDGDLHIQLFKTRDSPCIQCLSCMEFLSLKSFIKHMHLQDSSEELMEVTLPQKLELRNSKPTEQELAMWDEFQKIQKSYSQEHEGKLKSSIIRAVEAEIKHRDRLAQEEGSSAESSVSSATRHSTRVRKRKQLHPIEKYVFSKLLPVTEPAAKKGKYDPELEFADTRLNELESKLLPSEVKTELERMGKRMGLSVSPIRAVRVKKDTEEDKQVISKYDLRISSPTEESTLQTRRQKVLTRRNRNIDGNLTALEQEKD